MEALNSFFSSPLSAASLVAKQPQPALIPTPIQTVLISAGLGEYSVESKLGDRGSRRLFALLAVSCHHCRLLLGLFCLIHLLNGFISGS
jgi:hypothetical protein